MPDAQAQAPTFRAAAEGVTVEVSVQAGNRPVTGLRLSDFTLHDNGVPQTIVDLTYATLPIDVTVVLDISFSVSGALLDRLQRAVAQLVRDLPVEPVRRRDRLERHRAGTLPWSGSRPPRRSIGLTNLPIPDEGTAIVKREAAAVRQAATRERYRFLTFSSRSCRRPAG